VCLWVSASVREKEDLVSGLLKSSEWCLLGGREERLLSSARGLLLNFKEISFFKRCCKTRVEMGASTKGGETGEPYMERTCRMRVIIILLEAKQRGRTAFVC
jgi:hypothetical protein